MVDGIGPAGPANNQNPDVPTVGVSSVPPNSPPPVEPPAAPPIDLNVTTPVVADAAQPIQAPAPPPLPVLPADPAPQPQAVANAPVIVLPQSPEPTPAPASPVKPSDPLAGWHTDNAATPNVPPQIVSAPAAPIGRVPNQRRKLMIIGILALVLVLGSGGVIFVLSRSSGDNSAGQEQPTSSSTPAPKQKSVSEAAISNLAQANGSGAAVAAGGVVSATSLSLSWSGASDTTWIPQVEVQPVGTAFTDQPTTTASAEIKGSSAIVTVTGLAQGAYHWQARFKTSTDQSSWVAFGSNEESAADFSVDSTAPAAPKVLTVGGNSIAQDEETASTTKNRPVITGTAEANAKVNVSVQPNSLSFDAISDANGAWSITPNVDIANGETTLSITATDAAGNASTATTLVLEINSSPSAPAITEGLAPTGEPTWLLNLLGLLMMIGSLVTLGWIRRHAPR